MHFQYSCKLASKLLPPSEDCRLIKKNTSLEITETVELKNLLLGMKNIENSVNSVCKNVPYLQNYVQTNCPSVVPMLFKGIGIPLRNSLFESNFVTSDFFSWGSLAHLCNTDATYQQSLCSNNFFCNQPSEIVCSLYYFRKI